MGSGTDKPPDLRLAALRRFAVAITVLTVLGHGLLGFEQSYAYVLVALATAYATELLLETLDARSLGRAPWYAGGSSAFVQFLLPAHITGLACAMLLYSNERLWPIAFAVAVASGSKYILRVTVNGRSKHFLNPSNTGIAATLLLFPWVGIAPPYQFTENLSGVWDFALPALFIVVGTFLNARFTRKLPLIAGWLAGFFGQAVMRSALLDTPLLAALNPISGVAFLLFTFYMITDPGTTPFKRANQVTFGAAVAVVYGLLMALHVVFGLFFALALVCSVRGAYLCLTASRQERTATAAPAIEQKVVS